MYFCLFDYSSSLRAVDGSKGIVNVCYMSVFVHITVRDLFVCVSFVSLY